MFDYSSPFCTILNFIALALFLQWKNVVMVVAIILFAACVVW